MGQEVRLLEGHRFLFFFFHLHSNLCYHYYFAILLLAYQVRSAMVPVAHASLEFKVSFLYE
jgi:hypothetical protein